MFKKGLEDSACHVAQIYLLLLNLLSPSLTWSILSLVSFSWTLAESHLLVSSKSSFQSLPRPMVCVQEQQTVSPIVLQPDKES